MVGGGDLGNTVGKLGSLLSLSPQEPRGPGYSRGRAGPRILNTVDAMATAQRATIHPLGRPSLLG